MRNDNYEMDSESNVTGSTLSSSGSNVTDQPESNTEISMTGNPVHDDIIRESGLGWYPFKEFKNVEYVTSGGFSSIYKATLWGSTYALKCMKGSRELSDKLLTEVSVVLYLLDDIIPLIYISLSSLHRQCYIIK